LQELRSSAVKIPSNQTILSEGAKILLAIERIDERLVFGMGPADAGITVTDHSYECKIRGFSSRERFLPCRTLAGAINITKKENIADD
jgi:hypothetical protein